MKPPVHETQPALDRRTRIVQAFRDQRRAVSPRGFPEDLVTVQGEAIDQVQRALAQIGRGKGSELALLDAFEALDEIVADASSPRLRPWLNLGRRHHEALVKVSAGLELFLEVLTADTPGRAEELAGTGQGLIDDATAVLGEISRHEEILERSDGRAYMEVLGEAHAADGEPTEPIATLQAVGKKLGLPGDDVGLHVAIESIDVYASALDRRRVMAISEHVVGLLNDHGQGLHDAAWRADLVQALIVHDARANSFQAAIEADEAELVLVQAALDLASTVKERGLRTVAELLLVAAGHRTFDQLARKSSGAVIKLAEEHLPELGLDSLPRMLRHAGAHQDFHVEGEEIVLRREGVRFTVNEFIDQALLATESYQGILRGIFVTMADQGIELPAIDELSPRQRISLLRYLGVSFGLTGIELTTDGATVQITASGEVTSWPTLVAAMAEVLPENIQNVELQSAVGTDFRRGTARLTPYREFEPPAGTSDEDASMLRVLACCSVTTVDGRSPLEDHYWIGVAAHLAQERDGDFLVDRVRRVRAARNLARTAEVPTAAIDALLKRLRNSDS